MKTAIHHVGLTVKDIDRSIQFYSEVLGCTVIERMESDDPDIATITGLSGARVIAADLRLPNGDELELVEYTFPSGRPLTQQSCDPGHTHIGFCVDDADAAYERLVRMGGTPRSRPTQITAPGSLWDGSRVFYALDLDGRTIEIVQMR